MQSTVKKITQSVIWDNVQNIIVAKSNAPVADIAFTSFETTEKGNWEFTGDGIFEISSPAGKKCYNLTANSGLKKINLTAAKTYIISYWSKNGSYLVNGAAPFLTGTAINGWTYYKHKVTNALLVTISGNGYIDELRIHPENAQMTSVAFEPLIGLTSESGINGQITKYEYDSFGRLVSIKDQFGNVSKVFCYTSKGLSSFVAMCLFLKIIF
ncbi:MAG: RHS repeat protein [Chitinophagaceae bacterium]|nr:RHS repeat protein [Chitinophagaceae bacterium]